MAAPAIGDIMAGLETRLKTISGLRTSAYIADQITPPHAVIHLPDPIDYDSTFKKGMMELELSITVLVSAIVDRASQAAIGTYMDAVGTNSIVLAVDGDKTLGGVVDDCYVPSSRSLNQREVDGIGFHGCRFTVKVLAKGS